MFANAFLFHFPKARLNCIYMKRSFIIYKDLKKNVKGKT